MKKKKKKFKPDIVNPITGENWAYSRVVKSHFFKPRNLLFESPDLAEYDCQGIVGSPACGDVMRVWLKIDGKKDRIKEFKWRTFGCASAIAATSMLSVIATEKGGMKLDKAMLLRPQNITARLGGLPNRKIHCSVLGDKALRAAINNWFRKSNQVARIIPESSRMIDSQTKTTDADIEEAVLEGAQTIADIQKKTKVGIGNPGCLPEVEELLKFYKEKYFGK